MWTSMWSVHTLRFGPRQARRRPIVRALTLEHVAVDHPWAGLAGCGSRQARPAWFCGRAMAGRARTVRVGCALGFRPSSRF
jgi:hypothetical protein